MPKLTGRPKDVDNAVRAALLSSHDGSVRGVSDPAILAVALSLSPARQHSLIRNFHALKIANRAVPLEVLFPPPCFVSLPWPRPFPRPFLQLINDQW